MKDLKIEHMEFSRILKIYTIGEKGLLPINAVKRFNPLNFSQNICDYTKAGRKKIHDELLEVSSNELGELQHIRDPVETIEFNDNIISAYVVQKGMCYISKGKLILISVLPLEKSRIKNEIEIAIQI